ncbi:MAG: hypothetical protein MI867_12170, partial [Pseudomonadales bacterium]|nr:hypothetical protein [Pseudomonadales bacterium]
SKEKNYINHWLIDKDFIDSIEFRDKYYIENLFRTIYHFIKKCPLPLVSEWLHNTDEIKIMLGKKEFFHKININIAYFDFVTLIERPLRKFYPKYKVEIVESVPLSSEELKNKVLEGMDLAEAMEERKDNKYIENAILDRVYFEDDIFRIKVNDKVIFRISGSTKNPIGIYSFIKKLKKINTDEEKRDFIEENSIIVSVSPGEKDIYIDYSDRQMLNFFKINAPDLYQNNIESNGKGYRWGKYCFDFNSNQLKHECENILKNYRMRFNYGN